jgi:hypothetical protein
MSQRDDAEEARDQLRKPLLQTGSWYRMSSRQSSIMSSSAQMLRDGSVSVVLCVLIVALGPIQFGFTVITPPHIEFNLFRLFLVLNLYYVSLILSFFVHDCLVWLFFAYTSRNH